MSHGDVVVFSGQNRYLSDICFSVMDGRRTPWVARVWKCWMTRAVKSSTSVEVYSACSISSHASVVAPKSTWTFKGGSVNGYLALG